ncbi:MAG: RNA methyltransferase [Candidatus Melainabacteria bacterium]|nr:RNA methyltransferase [Candidatus Melainabacteria bacterium]
MAMSELKIGRGNVVFVLVRPNFLGNIGSIARVMKNFGFSNLYLVDPPRNYQDAESRKMAVGAFDILKKAKVFDRLDDALANCHLTVATSSCQYRTLIPQYPRDIINTITDLDSNTDLYKHEASIAFVFGDERDGLANQEIDLSHHLLKIPVQPDFPSLNLAQALGILAYELSEAIGFDDKEKNDAGNPGEIPQTLVPHSELAALGLLIDEVLGLVAFTRPHNRQLVHNELSLALKRMHPTQREHALIRGALYKIRDKLRSKYLDN